MHWSTASLNKHSISGEMRCMGEMNLTYIEKEQLVSITRSRSMRVADVTQGVADPHAGRWGVATRSCESWSAIRASSLEGRVAFLMSVWRACTRGIRGGEP